MTAKEKFIETIETGFFNNVDMNDIDPDVISFWENFKKNKKSEKNKVTSNGKIILEFLRNPTKESAEGWTSKAIAEELFLSSRTVSGSMRKLVTDGYVEKIGEDPMVYRITEEGKNVSLDS